MDQDLKGWFTEKSPMWPGQAFSLKVKNVLLDKHSKYQRIQIFESEAYGRVLVLDGAIQLTERDEASYQEMMAFLPLNSHPNPEKVLVIGGGDGGVVREVAKHPAVKRIVMCEIDSEVVEACREHIPTLAASFDDPRMELIIEDGMKFLRTCQEQFDVIITDSSDPVVLDTSTQDSTKDGMCLRPAMSLFNEEYYSLLHGRLKNGGILTSQGESMWLHRELIGNLIKKVRKCYPVVRYAYTCTPSYPCGQIGLLMCSKNPETKFTEPVRRFSAGDIEQLKLKYYNAEVHSAAFVLPTFMADYIDSL